MPTSLALTLGRALVEGERLTVRYRLPRAGPGLRAADGNQVAPFTVETVVGGGAPAVAGVTVVSDPGADATYAAGEAVRVALTFAEAVAVDTTNGTPRLKLDLDDGEDTGERWALYEDGSGTDTLTFAWTAAAPDESAGGVAVLADTLILDGGAIRSVASQTDAALGHAGIAHDAGHKVDWRPAVSVADGRRRSGRGASSSFSGRDGPLTVNGEVTSATLGADWRAGSWLLGAMVKHSIGEGDYSGDGGSGDVESTLTGIYPYAAVDLRSLCSRRASRGVAFPEMRRGGHRSLPVRCA